MTAREGEPDFSERARNDLAYRLAVDLATKFDQIPTHNWRLRLRDALADLAREAYDQGRAAQAWRPEVRKIAAWAQGILNCTDCKDAAVGAERIATIAGALLAIPAPPAKGGEDD